MNKANIRLAIIAIMTIACVMLLASDSDSLSAFVWSKIIGFAMMPVIALLYNYWDKRGALGE